MLMMMVMVLVVVVGIDRLWQEADDAFDDLEDFLWQPGMPL